MRLELVLIFAVLFVVALAAMRLGWRNRGRRQADLPPLPPIPGSAGPDVAPPLTGMYIGTTTALHWQDRIVVHGLGERAAATAHLSAAGVIIDREGSEAIFVPNGALLDARVEAAIAGKVIGTGGLLVLRWRHGGRELDTGLRGDDRSVYVQWIRALQSRTEVGRAEAEPSGWGSEK